MPSQAQARTRICEIGKRGEEGGVGGLHAEVLKFVDSLKVERLAQVEAVHICIELRVAAAKNLQELRLDRCQILCRGAPRNVRNRALQEFTVRWKGGKEVRDGGNGGWGGGGNESGRVKRAQE